MADGGTVDSFVSIDIYLVFIYKMQWRDDWYVHMAWNSECSLGCPLCKNSKGRRRLPSKKKLLYCITNDEWRWNVNTCVFFWYCAGRQGIMGMLS